jgi:outer membrane protein TolC
MTRTVQTVTYGVTQSYYEVLRAKHLADVASSSVKYNEGLRDLIKARIEAGDAAEVDVLPVEAQLATAHVNLLTAQNNVRTATVQLQNDMGLSPQPGFDVQEAGAVPEPEIRPIDAYVSTALASRPDIQGSKAGLGAANASVKSARLSVYPRPIISGQYELGLAGLSGSSTQIVGGISLDLFNGSRTRAALKEAQASKANAEQRSTQVTKDVQSQVQQAYLNLTSSKERLAASNVGLNAAQKNYDVQSARYKQGLAIPLDLLNAELQVVTAQSNAVQARYDYYISLAQMDFAVGRQGGFNAG